MICNAIEGNSIVFPLTGEKIPAAFTDCMAYRRSLGSVLYIGHDSCSYLGLESDYHALEHTYTFSHPNFFCMG